MSKFVKIPPQYGWRKNLEELATLAFPAGTDKLDVATFKKFSNRHDVEPFNRLRGFIEDQAAKGQAPSVESRMRLQISTLEKHVQKLFERLERLQTKLPDFVEACIEYVSAWGRRKRWEFVMQNLRQLVLSLHQCAESMHTTLADLSSSLKEDEATQGLSSVIEPHRRFQQEQMVVEAAHRVHRAQRGPRIGPGLHERHECHSGGGARACGGHVTATCGGEQKCYEAGPQ